MYKMSYNLSVTILNTLFTISTCEEDERYCCFLLKTNINTGGLGKRKIV